MKKRKDLSPYNINKRNWFYCSRSGKSILLVHEVYNKAGEYLQTDIIKIRLSSIKRNLMMR